MRHPLLLACLCAVLASAAIADAGPAEQLPVFVKYTISYSGTFGSIRHLSTGSVEINGTLKRVEKWSYPRKEKNHYRGQVTISYIYQFRILDHDPNRDCPPLVCEWSCAGSQTKDRVDLEMNYWGEAHAGRPSEYAFRCPGVHDTATGVAISRRDCLSEDITQGTTIGNAVIEGKYTHGQEVIRGSCSWSGPGQPTNYEYAGTLGVIVSDGEPITLPFNPDATVVGNVFWLFGADAAVIIEQQLEGMWTDITDPDWKQPAVAGEAIELRGRVLPESQDTGRGEWTIEHDKGGDGPKFIKKFEADEKRGKVIRLTAEDKKKQNIKFYWVDSGGGRVKYVTTAGGKKLDAEARFDIERPEVELSVDAQDESEFGRLSSGGYILAYQKGSKLGIHWRVKDMDKPGETQYVQIVDQQEQAVCIPESNYPGPNRCNGTGLDKTYPYSRGPEAKDAPGIPSDWRFSSRSADFQFKMYLMFKPAGREDNEWVPLKRTDWSWGGKIAWDPDKDPEWCKIYSREPHDPQPVDTADYPEWDMNCKDLPVEWLNPETGEWEEIEVNWEE